MKSVTRRKQQQDELRAKILDAARELFVTHGVEAVSMRKVAEKIGYTATTLYNHFEDKDALLRALCDADFGTLHESFARIGRIADPIDRLRKLGQAYIEFSLQYPSHYRLMFMTPHPARDAECVRRDRSRRPRSGRLRIRPRDGRRGARRRAVPRRLSRPGPACRRCSGAACTAWQLCI